MNLYFIKNEVGLGFPQHRGGSFKKEGGWKVQFLISIGKQVDKNDI